MLSIRHPSFVIRNDLLATLRLSTLWIAGAALLVDGGAAIVDISGASAAKAGVGRGV